MALSPTWNTALLTGSRAAWLATILLIGVAIAAGVRSVRTARDPVTRAQTRWILWTCGVGLVVLMPGYVLPLLLTGSPLLPHPVIMLVIAAMPVSLAFAILRHRLFEIEVVINRSLVYGTLTVLLAAVFGASLFAFSQVFQVLMGDQQLVIAMTASALIVGALFQPMRRHLQRFVDQRFFGIHIDYQKKAEPPSVMTIGAPARPQLDEYTELRLVGQGGAAAVYSARHPSLNRTVAIKVLSEHLIQESDFRRRFEREARIIASLRHRSIVQVYDFGEQEGLYYMVMEYVDGPDLGSLLREQGRMPLTEALPLVCDIASALDYAHEQDLVHRDIKPSNVMLDPISEVEGNAPYRAVLMDFGLAKMIGGSTRLTQPGMVGTLSYIAPEQIQAAADVDRRADIYAFGVMTYEMLVGELPFKRQDPGALLIAHLTQPPPDPRSLVPELSDNVACALQRALAKNPNERYPSAGAFAEALKEPSSFGKFG
jgi:tRNA A-37 threonylcarbamoyl transferase component Bud32